MYIIPDTSYPFHSYHIPTIPCLSVYHIIILFYVRVYSISIPCLTIWFSKDIWHTKFRIYYKSIFHISSLHKDLIYSRYRASLHDMESDYIHDFITLQLWNRSGIGRDSRFEPGCCCGAHHLRGCRGRGNGLVILSKQCMKMMMIISILISDLHIYIYM